MTDLTSDPIKATEDGPESKYVRGYVRGLSNEMAALEGCTGGALDRTARELLALAEASNTEVVEWVQGYIAGAREIRASS